MRSSLLANKAYKIFRIVWIPAILALSYYISSNWYQLSLIRGDSMSPAYHNMQFTLIDRHSRDYTYGDVITFQCDNLDAALVKRIIACPGDQVLIRNGTLYVNDAVSNIFSQEYIFEYAGIAQVPVCLGEDQYFVIGDNLRESKDSRYEEVGIVCGEDIVGKIIP